MRSTLGLFPNFAFKNNSNVESINTQEDVLLVEFRLCTMYLYACQVRVTVSDSGLCSRVRVASFEALISSLVC